MHSVFNVSKFSISVYMWPLKKKLQNNIISIITILQLQRIIPPPPPIQTGLECCLPVTQILTRQP